MLRYSHEPLVLTTQGNTSIVVPANAIATVLNAIKQQVNSGSFDNALQAIKNTRVTALKATLSKKKQAVAPAAANTDNAAGNKAA